MFRLVFVFWIFSVSCSYGDDVTERHRKVAREVFDNVIDVVESAEGWDQWPPIFQVQDTPVINAFAGPKQGTRKKIPLIRVNRGLIEFTEFDSDVLALTVCHEFGHLLNFHVRKRQLRAEKLGAFGAATAIKAVYREAELEADVFGADLTLKSGYTREGIRRNLRSWIESGKIPNLSPFQALVHDHPAWEQRAAYVEKGTPHEILWQTSATFQNGVHFLAEEDYRHAADCFQNVVSEFPMSFEGWSNLGYAYLMQHIDNLPAEKISSLTKGPLVNGCFYRQPKSLHCLCEIEESKMEGRERLQGELAGNPIQKARLAFDKAIELKPSVAKELDPEILNANLAILELFDSKNNNRKLAAEIYSEVCKRLRNKTEDATNPIAMAAIWINAGVVVDLDVASIKKGIRTIQKAKRKGNVSRRKLAELEDNLNYLRSLELSKSKNKTDRKKAIELMDVYLKTTLPTNVWNSKAFSNYENLAKELGQSIKTKSRFRQLTVSDWRRQTSIVIESEKTIGLSRITDSVLPNLGEADRVDTVIDGEQLKRYYFDDTGISILGCREVLAVFLDSPGAPPIELKRPGFSGPSELLKVGMKRAQLESLIGDEWSVEYTSIDDPKTIYHFYRPLGIAARFQDGDVVTLVLVAVPPKG